MQSYLHIHMTAEHLWVGYSDKTWAQQFFLPAEVLYDRQLKSFVSGDVISRSKGNFGSQHYILYDKQVPEQSSQGHFMTWDGQEAGLRLRRSWFTFEGILCWQRKQHQMIWPHSCKWSYDQN